MLDRALSNVPNAGSRESRLCGWGGLQLGLKRKCLFSSCTSEENVTNFNEGFFDFG
jgi:hypothetical protein